MDGKQKCTRQGHIDMEAYSSSNERKRQTHTHTEKKCVLSICVCVCECWSISRIRQCSTKHTTNESNRSQLKLPVYDNPICLLFEIAIQHLVSFSVSYHKSQKFHIFRSSLLLSSQFVCHCCVYGLWYQLNNFTILASPSFPTTVSRPSSVSIVCIIPFCINVKPEPRGWAAKR